MKRLLAITASIMMLLGIGQAYGQTDDTRLVDVSELRLINRAFSDVSNPYTRIPDRLRAQCRSGLWDRGQCSAGMGVRFATNSRRIGVKYNLIFNAHMNHMADTGLKGMDLYILDGDSAWRHVNTYRPADKRAQEGNFVELLDGAMHEYMVYFPLYDGLQSVQLKIDANAEINNGNPEVIDRSKKIVAYGTSILQGGCSSRTGMVATSIISRALNCEVANLGFSGEGKMDMFMAEAMAGIEDADLFLLDPVPNCDEDMCRDLTYDFVNTIRKLRPEVPIVMVEGPLYPYYRYNSCFNKYLPDKNKAYRANYEKLIAENPNNLYYVTADGLDGWEDDGTIDGVHLSDLGFKNYAAKLIPVLANLIKGERLLITAPFDGTTEMSLTPTFEWTKGERKATLQIATSNTFSAKEMVYTADATNGRHDVPPYVLAASTRYYARVVYTMDDIQCSSPIVSFTTLAMTPENPSIHYPTDGGELYANEAVSVKQIEGVTSVRLEISSDTKFGGRTSYVSSNIGSGNWVDGKTGSEIRIGGKALTDGATYYARVRSTYNLPEGGTANSEYSEPISFTYRNKDSGVASVTGNNNAALAIEGNGSSSPVLTVGITGEASVKVLSLAGKEIASVHNGFISAGTRLEPALAPGIYIVTLESSEGAAVEKLVVK